MGSRLAGYSDTNISNAMLLVFTLNAQHYTMDIIKPKANKWDVATTTIEAPQ